MKKCDKIMVINRPKSMLDLQLEIDELKVKLRQSEEKINLCESRVTTLSEGMQQKLANFRQTIIADQQCIKQINEDAQEISNQLESIDSQIRNDKMTSSGFILMAQFTLQIEVLAEGNQPRSIDSIGLVLKEKYGTVGTAILLNSLIKAVRTMNKPYLQSIVEQLSKYFKGQKGEDLETAEDDSVSQNIPVIPINSDGIIIDDLPINVKETLIEDESEFEENPLPVEVTEIGEEDLEEEELPPSDIADDNTASSSKPVILPVPSLTELKPDDQNMLTTQSLETFEQKIAQSFCQKCGVSINEGEPHDCSEVPIAPIIDPLKKKTKRGKKADSDPISQTTPQ